MIQLSYPAVLLIAPAAVALLFALSRKRARDTSRLRRVASLLARCLAASLLILAMSGPAALRAIGHPPCVIFAVDVSESVDDSALEEAARAIEADSARVAAAGGWTGLVAFAGRAAVLRPAVREPLSLAGDIRERLFWRRSESALRTAAEGADEAARDRLAQLGAWRESLDVLATRLAPAVSAAETLYRPDGDNRTVILSDGRETSGAARLPANDRVLWVRMPPSKRRDLVVTGLSAPPAVRHGEPFDIDVEVETTFPGDVQLALTVDDLGQAVPVQRFRLAAPGRTTLTFGAPQALRSLLPGLHRLLVIASQEGEEERRNNSAFAGVTILGKPEVLLVEGAPLDGEAAARILAAQQIDYGRIPADRLSSRTDALDRYAAVVLAGVAPSALHPPDIAALRQYVEDGGGLLLIASSRWTAQEGFDRQEFSALLPLEWTPPAQPPDIKPTPPGPKPPPVSGRGDPKRVLAPTIALLLMIDKSGSMAGRNIELAREACIAAAETLSEGDKVGVLAFDVRPKWIVEWTRADSREYLQRQLLRLQADGGTNIHSALVEGAHSFSADPRASGAGVKHIILLSDGVTPPANFEETLSAMARDGITVTTVCISTSEFDPQLMQAIAAIGRGRFLVAADFRNVPRIFTNEARFVVKESARAAEAKAPPIEPPKVEQPVVDPAPAPARRRVAVRFKDVHEVVKGVGRDLPALEGLLGSRPRQTAYVPLASEDGQPVLAIWRYGLGKTAVWTSDLGGPWSQEWAAWKEAPRLFAQVVRHLASASENGDLASRVGVVLEGDRLTVSVDAAPEREDLEMHVLSPRRERSELLATADGRRAATVALDPAGALYQMLLVRRGEHEERFSLAALQTYPRELAWSADRAFEGLPAPPRALADLNRLIPPVPAGTESRQDLSIWCLLAAVLLLPLDVALRRIRR